MHDWDIKEALELENAINTTAPIQASTLGGDKKSRIICLITTDGRLYIADRLNRNQLQPWTMNDE